MSPHHDHEADRAGRRRVHLALLVGATLLLAACGVGGPSGWSPASGWVGLHWPSLTNRLHPAPVPVRAVPAVPTDLRVLADDGTDLAPDTWTNQAHWWLAATFAAPADGALLSAEAEFVPAEKPFTGTPNLIGEPGTSRIAAPDLVSGQRYRWQVRVREAGGRPSPWAAFSATLGFSNTPTPAAAIAPLPADLLVDGVLGRRAVEVRWAAVSNMAPNKPGIAGYAYSLDRRPQLPDDALPADLAGDATVAAIEASEDGDWYFHLRALDRAGNWSFVATLPLRVDTTLPAFENVRYRTFAYHPSYGTLPISFSLSKPATATVAILPASGDTPLRTYALGPQEGDVRVEWNGRDERGVVVPPGSYRFRLAATDQLGHSAEAVYDKLLVTQKRIEVSLTRQALWAYDGDQLVVQTLITSGGPELPTPAGTFQILAKYSPFTFHSPWPKRSPFWYPDSPATFALLFEDGGYFLHDAPWRHTFGPGSNAAMGTPGGDSTGTHGCINLPHGIAARLFAWADVGTPVTIGY